MFISPLTLHYLRATALAFTASMVTAVLSTDAVAQSAVLAGQVRRIVQPTRSCHVMLCLAE